MGYAIRHVVLVKSMKGAYAALRRTTKEWTRGDDGVAWHLRVLDAMLELDLWKGMGLSVLYPMGRPAEPAVAAPGDARAAAARARQADTGAAAAAGGTVLGALGASSAALVFDYPKLQQ